MEIKLLNNSFILHPYGAMYWTAKSCLFIADIHLGKSTHFRKNGSAIPDFTDVENYRKLDILLQEFDVKQILFLGDLFHSVYNSSWSAFEDWVKRQKCKFDLVIGNHDVISTHHFNKIGIKTYKNLQIDDFSFTHHPQKNPETFNFCGHLHPGFRLRGNGKQLLNLACFYLQPKQMVLPAFGEFTGHYYVNPKHKEQIFIIAEDEVLKV